VEMKDYFRITLFHMDVQQSITLVAAGIPSW